MAKKTTSKKSKKTKNKPTNKKIIESSDITKDQEVLLKPIPSVLELSKNTLNVIWLNKQLFIYLTLVYSFLSLFLVQGVISQGSVDSVKTQLSKVFSGHLSGLGTTFSSFAILLGSSPSNSQSPSGYQLILGLITSLAVIWSLRHLYSRTDFDFKDAFYKSMTPFIPFVLILVVISLQLIPLLIGATLYSAVITGGVAVGWLEKAIFILIFLALALASLYLITSSSMALYIVTLENMTPIKALRSAKQLVKGRRWVVLRKILYLPIAIVIAGSIVMLPFILLLTFISPWIYFLLTSFSLIVIHSYLYNLYRELLNET